MKFIRRIIIKGYTVDRRGDNIDMNYMTGNEVYGGHVIEKIVEDEGHNIDIYIVKDDVETIWKRIHNGIPVILEYNL